MSQWKPWKTVTEMANKKVLAKFNIDDGNIHIEDVEIDVIDNIPYYSLFDDGVFSRMFDTDTIDWVKIPEENEWKPWETSSEMAGKKVLIKFEMADGNIHIEDAEIQIVDNNPYYVLFDGDTLNANIVGWTHIPE